MGELQSDYIEDRTHSMSSKSVDLPSVDTYDGALDEMDNAESENTRWEFLRSAIRMGCKEELERSDEEVDDLTELLNDEAYDEAEDQITQWYDEVSA